MTATLTERIKVIEARLDRLPQDDPRRLVLVELLRDLRRANGDTR